MEDRRTIQVPVPDGFPPMSLPVDPQNRYRDEEIILEPAKEEDLIAIIYLLNMFELILALSLHQADGLYRCFPDVWWCETEALSRRPPEDIRVGRFAERLRPLVTHDPRFVFVVAKVASTGEFAGVAGWHSPDDQWNGNMWLCDVPGGLKQGSLGWTSGLKRMPNEIQEIWDAVDVDAWLAMWNAYERVRKEEMGSEPHW
ncbi:MAG: hypothetical protein M1818_007989 [Claussenomyces sp. TS43310]|nr:MAG: hypothetical protein M1818_007989 [Claussenomyces sp. TS43310]